MIQRKSTGTTYTIGIPGILCAMNGSNEEFVVSREIAGPRIALEGILKNFS